MENIEHTNDLDPVYGEFGKWTEAPFSGKLLESFNFVSSIIGIDINLFTYYVLFVFDHIGYKCCDKPMTQSDWVDRILDTLSLEEISLLCFGNNPEEYFENGSRVVKNSEKNDAIGILFISSILQLPIEDSLEGAYDAIKRREASKNRFKYPPVEPTRKLIVVDLPRYEYSNCGAFYIIIDPRIDTKDVQCGIDEIRKELGDDAILTIEELEQKFLRDISLVQKVRNEWKQIRTKALKKATQNHPRVRHYLIMTQNHLAINEIKKMLIQAERKQVNKQYKDAIRDVGEAIEKFIRLLYGGEWDKLGDILKNNEEKIRKELGKMSLDYINTIRVYRNKYSHPSERSTEESGSAICHECIVLGNMLIKIWQEKFGVD